MVLSTLRGRRKEEVEVGHTEVYLEISFLHMTVSHVAAVELSALWERRKEAAEVEYPEVFGQQSFFYMTVWPVVSGVSAWK